MTVSSKWLSPMPRLLILLGATRSCPCRLALSPLASLASLVSHSVRSLAGRMLHLRSQTYDPEYVTARCRAIPLAVAARQVGEPSPPALHTHNHETDNTDSSAFSTVPPCMLGHRRPHVRESE